LNIAAVTPSTPRSLRAFSVQLNHGAVCIARNMKANPTTGAMNPSQPKSLTVFTSMDVTHLPLVFKDY
jgi:hypothetical protein